MRLIVTGFTLTALALFAAPCLAKDDYRSLSKRWEEVRAKLEKRRISPKDRGEQEKALGEVAPKLLKSNQQKAVKLLLDKGLGSRSHAVVRSSMRTLEQADDKRALRLVIKAFGSAKPMGRKRQLAKVLSALPSKDVVAPLVKALRDGEPWVRVSAAAALGERGAKVKAEAKRPLERLAKRDASLMVRAAAADALELIGADRPKALPPAKTGADGIHDRFYADRVAFVLDATGAAAKVAYQDPFAEKKDDEKELGEEKGGKGKRKGKDKDAKPVKPVSPYKLMTSKVLEAVKRMDRGTTRFTALRFGGQVSFFEREFLKPNRRAIAGLETWSRTLPGRDQNRDVARAIRTLLDLDPPPQVIYVFLTGPAVTRGRITTEESLAAIGELLAEQPVRIHVISFAIPPEQEPSSELGKSRLRAEQRKYSGFVGELAKLGGGDTNSIDLAPAASEEAPDDKKGETKAKKLDVDMTKALSRRDTSRLKKALRIRKGQSDNADAVELVEQLAACPDARKATPMALKELRGDDVDLSDAALRGFQKNGDAKVHAELLKALKAERDPILKVRLLKASAKHPGIAITTALIDMTGNPKDRDLDRIVWRILSERPAAELSSAKAKLTRKARAAPKGLATYYANTAVALAAGRQPPSSSGLKAGADRFLPDRFNADGVAFVVDSNHDMKTPFWKPAAAPKKPAVEDDPKDKKKKKKKKRKRRDKKKKGEEAKKQPDPVPGLKAATLEVERALRAAAKGGVSANVFLTGGRSWKSACSPLQRGALKDAIQWLQGLRTGGQRDVWTAIQRALSDPSCERIYLLVSGLPIRSPGAAGKTADLHRKVRELNNTRDVEIHVTYVLPPVAPDDTQGDAVRRDLLQGMDALYKPLAAQSGGEVVVRHKLVGLGKPPAKPAK